MRDHVQGRSGRCRVNPDRTLRLASLGSGVGMARVDASGAGGAAPGALGPDVGAHGPGGAARGRPGPGCRPGGLRRPCRALARACSPAPWTGTGWSARRSGSSSPPRSGNGEDASVGQAAADVMTAAAWRLDLSPDGWRVAAAELFDAAARQPRSRPVRGHSVAGLQPGRKRPSRDRRAAG